MKGLIRGIVVAGCVAGLVVGFGARVEARPNRLQERRIRKNLRMAIHAGLGGRNPCETRLLDRRVTVAAVDAVACHVSFVTELDRLLARDVLPRDPR